MKFKMSFYLFLLGITFNGVALSDDEPKRVLVKGGLAEKCDLLIKSASDDAGKKKDPDYVKCHHLQQLSLSAGNSLETQVRVTEKKSTDGRISCVQLASYTIDYKPCEKVLTLYNGVLIAEMAMDLEQKVRTDLKNKSIQENAMKKAAEGDLQTGAYDAALESHQHMKAMNTEKMIAYVSAVGALGAANTMFPDEKKAIKKCEAAIEPKECSKTMRSHGAEILANIDNKSAIATAIMAFTAKAAAAGIALSRNYESAKKINQVKKNFDDQGTNLMMERCLFNPADPLCADKGRRISGNGAFAGDFGMGGNGADNSFDMNPENEAFGEAGAETNLDDKNEVASINSPFRDEAQTDDGILNPAGAAQVQSTGGSGGGSGSGGGGGGGGGASLGNDLQGADKEGDKEPQIKTNKVSGIYGASGGDGFKGVSRGKDEANPFSSLFDQKSGGGGVEEDRSIASGDIDGKYSGLFEKISKRYNLIQADKRIEAQNLE